MDQKNKDKSSDKLSSKLDSMFSDKPVTEQTSDLVTTLRTTFDNNVGKVITVKQIRDVTGYSNVRINNVLREQVDKGYLTRSMSNGRYYYKRNTV